MNKIKLIIVCAFLMISLDASAQNCDRPQSAENVRIYFVNSIFNIFLSAATGNDLVVTCN